MKQISIIIATYNAESTLQRCLDSIKYQKDNEIELLVIDGKSEDNTYDLIIQNNDIIDFYLSEIDKGIYDAWNKGIKNSTANWLMFLGADDILLPDALKKLLREVKHSTYVDIISGKAELVDKSGALLKTMGNAYDWNIFRRRMNISHGSTLHNRRLFEEVGLFDINFKICGDYELLLRKRLSSVFIDEYIIQMQDGGMSTTFKAREEAYLARKKNKSLPSFFNRFIALREKLGYIIKYRKIE